MPFYLLKVNIVFSMLRTCITRALQQRKLPGVTLSMCRHESNSTNDHKSNWAARVRELQYKNPVRLKRRPSLFANSSSHNRGREYRQGGYGEERRENYRQSRPARM